MSDSALYNLEKGFLSFGPELLMEVIENFPSLRDLRQFIGLCQTTFELTSHQYFPWALSKFSLKPIYSLLLPGKDPTVCLI